MIEAREQEAGHQELFQSICQRFGSADVVELLVTCFGKEMTGIALEKLGVSCGMPGVQLVEIYMHNRICDVEPQDAGGFEAGADSSHVQSTLARPRTFEEEQAFVEQYGYYTDPLGR